MCGRFETTGKFSWAEIHSALSSFAPVVTQPLNFEQNDDVRPTTNQATARLGEDGWIVEKMRWGLVPFWRNGKPLKDTAKGADDGFKLTTFNARSESCAGASTFREAFAKRRCIVPASAWFEWTGEKGSKTKHRFARTDGELLWFAGIWDRVTTPDAGKFASFTIITGGSDGWLSDYHSRAPVILDRDHWRQWLDPTSDARDLIAAVRPERFAVG